MVGDQPPLLVIVGRVYVASSGAIVDVVVDALASACSCPVASAFARGHKAAIGGVVASSAFC
jgi:hypothetical protein